MLKGKCGLSGLRIEILSSEFSKIIRDLFPYGGRALDLGCGDGSIGRRIAEQTCVEVFGLDPTAARSGEGLELVKGLGHCLPFKDQVFDVVILASVFEHFKPEQRLPSVKEVFRVLKKNGRLVGQIPNMYFPIELHSGLPLQQYLPKRVSDAYLHLRFPKGVTSDWYRVSVKELNNVAMLSGFRLEFVRRHNYSREVIPYAFRWAFPLLSICPLGFLFSFRKSH